MKRKIILNFILITILVCTLCFSTSCKKNDKLIEVCASELPHADILENCVAPLLKEQGYELKVTVLDWSIQNDAVVHDDYDANYFQHLPYLETYGGNSKLIATCKVHYEPLGIYRGRSNGSLSEGKTFAICDDESNAIRALELLYKNGVIDELPVTNGNKLNFNTSSWTSSNGVTVTLIKETLLVASLPDYDFVCLPGNTAYTGNVSQSKKVVEEDDPIQIAAKANVLVARKDDYQNDEAYKAKIDALTNVLLSDEVANYVKERFEGAIVCNNNSQIDLRK